MTAPFAQRIAGARRVLVIDLGGLGDVIHALPALGLLRETLPQVELHAMVPSPSASLLRGCVPWIDAVLSYDKAGLRSDLGWIRRLRAQRFDAAIALTASNHAVAFAGLSGAPARLVRHADENKRWSWQPWLVTDVAEVPFHTEPMYRQKWRALAAVGCAGTLPAALTVDGLAIDAASRRARGIAAEYDGRYLHLSASASDDARDLPPAQTIALWRALAARFPDRPLVVTAAGNARARDRLALLLQGLGFAPWQVHAGDLDVPAFASIVQGAALHVGPDSGGLHVARLVGTPSVSWFRPNHHLANWLPDEPGHRAFVAPDSRPDGLHGLDLAALVDAAAERLAAR